MIFDNNLSSYIKLNPITSYCKVRVKKCDYFNGLFLFINHLFNFLILFFYVDDIYILMLMMPS